MNKQSGNRSRVLDAQRMVAMHRILPKIESPEDLKLLDHQELEILCQEMRDELVRVLSLRPAHFASNLGVVELCVALHLSYDFSKDRIIWDTGHQIYPHKLITGRYRNFDTIRTKGGLMGYPNPAESEFDLFMTGHAGCSLSTALLSLEMARYPQELCLKHLTTLAALIKTSL